jgi:hypothetical protein
VQNPNIDELPGRMDAVEGAEQAADVRMKAIVLKNYSYPVTRAAIIAREMAPEVEVFDPYNCSKRIQ